MAKTRHPRRISRKTHLRTRKTKRGTYTTTTVQGSVYRRKS